MDLSTTPMRAYWHTLFQIGANWRNDSVQRAYRRALLVRMDTMDVEHGAAHPMAELRGTLFSYGIRQSLQLTPARVWIP